jgi:hypothetical protein
MTSSWLDSRRSRPTPVSRYSFLESLDKPGIGSQKEIEAAYIGIVCLLRVSAQFIVELVFHPGICT